MSEAAPLVSVVVPLRNEEEVLPQFAERLSAALEGVAPDWEVILVDDGSTDGTCGVICAGANPEPAYTSEGDWASVIGQPLRRPDTSSVTERSPSSEERLQRRRTGLEWGRMTSLRCTRS